MDLIKVLASTHTLKKDSKSFSMNPGDTIYVVELDKVLLHNTSSEVGCEQCPLEEHPKICYKILINSSSPSIYCRMEEIDI